MHENKLSSANAARPHKVIMYRKSRNETFGLGLTDLEEVIILALVLKDTLHNRIFLGHSRLTEKAYIG